MNGTAFVIINNKTKEAVDIRLDEESAKLAVNYYNRVQGSSFIYKPCTWQLTQQ